MAIRRPGAISRALRYELVMPEPSLPKASRTVVMSGFIINRWPAFMPPMWSHWVKITRPFDISDGETRCERLRAPRTSPEPSRFITPIWAVVPRSYSSWN